MEEISAILNDINLITRVKFDLYDGNFNILHGEGKNMCEFCSLVRLCPECREKCKESDLNAFRRSQETKKAYTYKCHMGLTETVTPIICDGNIVGYIMMGQKLMGEDVDAVKRNVESFPDEKSREKMRDALAKMKFTDIEELNAARKLVEICASYLHMKKLIKYRETPLSVLLDSYIGEHLRDELDVKKMCKEFKMSKSSLYLVSYESFGMGITEYIREKRLGCAKELLRTTEAPISEIAESVGYTDSNYFTKVFKKSTGVTPSKWRGNGMGKITNK
jgi:AraC-like DNA-binding protein